jgi:hypothetical protein
MWWVSPTLQISREETSHWSSRFGLGHVPASPFAFTAPRRAVLHDLAVSLLALVGAAAARLGARLVRVRSERAGPSGQGRGQNAERLAIHGQLVRLGVMLPVFASPRLEVFKAVMGRFVASPDTLSQDLQMSVVLVKVLPLLLFLCLGLVPASHEQSSRSCPDAAQEFSTVHDRLLLRQSECDTTGRMAGISCNSRETAVQLLRQPEVTVARRCAAVS